MPTWTISSSHQFNVVIFYPKHCNYNLIICLRMPTCSTEPCDSCPFSTKREYCPCQLHQPQCRTLHTTLCLTNNWNHLNTTQWMWCSMDSGASRVSSSLPPSPFPTNPPGRPTCRPRRWRDALMERCVPPRGRKKIHGSCLPYIEKSDGGSNWQAPKENHFVLK